MDQQFEKAKDLFVDGVRCFEAGRFADALSRFEASLALLPDRTTTLANLAAAQLKLARPGAALAALDRLLGLEPGNLQGWCLRGEALADLERHAQALECFDKALAIDAALAAAWFQRGLALNRLRRHADALSTFETLLRLQPDRADGWFRHGQALQHLDRHDEALASYDKALARDPRHARAWSNRGGILKDLRRPDEAAVCFEKAIAFGADAEVNGYFLAALAARDAPPVAPRPYVEKLFDDYADTFDAHLVDGLGYQAHRVLAGMLAGRHFESALDLGCGTGLCGPLVKSWVDRLDGVDLSRNMLDKARSLGVYGQLVQADIVDHLLATDSRYQLALSADVFIYVGDLAPVFRGVRRVIEPGGAFCFSVEAADDARDFELRASLRYAHSQRYVRTLAHQHGFDVVDILHRPIRHDQRQPIQGMFALLSAR